MKFREVVSDMLMVTGALIAVAGVAVRPRTDTPNEVWDSEEDVVKCHEPKPRVTPKDIPLEELIKQEA